MNRTNFYHKEIVADVSELDFLHNSLSSFEMKYQPQYYRVTGPDIRRPYLISQRFYGSPSFWWLILLVNDISNPLCDMEVGELLMIPSRLDIYAFQKKFRVRRST